MPLLNYKEDRSVLKDWFQKQGDAKIKEYWKEKDSVSIDGFKTKIN